MIIILWIPVYNFRSKSGSHVFPWTKQMDRGEEIVEIQFVNKKNKKP